mgnify:FL=1
MISKKKMRVWHYNNEGSAVAQPIGYADSVEVDRQTLKATGLLVINNKHDGEMMFAFNKNSWIRWDYYE